ncbi:MAG: hypothetical protein RLZZ385_2156 [Pseudomonadota bacterium]|jgi:hypothetical protein
MNRVHGFHRIVTDLAEIADILNVAQLHGWRFSYSVSDMVPGVAFVTELKDIDPEEQVITIGSEVKYVGLEPFERLQFNVRNGGISISFSSHLLPPNLDVSGKKWRGDCQVALPTRLVYGQQRQAVRVNLARIEKVPVTLFTGDGKQVTGSVDDISMGGLRARFACNVVSQLEASRLITDCALTLPDTSVIKARVQVLGGIRDTERDTGFMRFRFLELNSDVELKLEALILDSLRSRPQSASA